MDGIGKIIEGTAAYDSGKYNQAASQNQAINAERDGTVVEGRVRDAARLAIGQQIGAQGADGFQMGTGSAIDALTQSQINATLDALTARRTAAAKAQGLRAQGDLAYTAGKNARVQGYLGAVQDWANDAAKAMGG